MNTKTEQGKTQVAPAGREETERKKMYEAAIKNLSRPNTTSCPHCGHPLEIK